MKLFRLHYLSSLSITIVISLSLIGCSSTDKVNSPTITPKNKPKVVVGKKAAIIGGLPALQQKLVYPDKAKKRGIETVLQAKVLVNKEGKVEQVSFDRATEYGFEQAAKNALYQVDFTHGEQNGEPIRMFITIPVKFKLN